MTISNTEFAATVGKTVQVSQDDWVFRKTTKTFPLNTSIFDVLKWASSLGIKVPTISSIQFNDLDK